jgi:hypothetical protein
MGVCPASRAGRKDATMVRSRKGLTEPQTWAEYRKRMLEETSRFIEWGLHHPELVIEIPIKPAAHGSFPAKVGAWFWGVVLSERPTDKIRRWQDFLLSRPKGLLRRLGGS